MRRSPVPVILLLVLSVCGLTAAGPALPLLHSIFADHVVLQRGVPVPVWGWATAGTGVEVTFAGQEKRAVGDASGRWIVRLDRAPTPFPGACSARAAT